MGNPTSHLLQPVFNYKLEGYSIIMRPIMDNDIGQKWVSWLNDPEINRYLEFSKYGKKQSTEDVIEYVNMRRSEGTEVFGIVTKREKILVGTSGLINWKKKVEFKNISNLGIINKDLISDSGPLGFGLMIGDKKAQSIGVGGEAYLYMISFILEIIKDPMIFNMAVSQHNKVIAMARQFGFEKIYTLRNHVELSDGNYDSDILTLTKTAWAAKKRRFEFFLDRLHIIPNDE